MAPELDAEYLVLKALTTWRNRLGPDATLHDAAVEMHNDMAASFEARWNASGNPIWVWRALARLSSLCIYASSACPELKGRTMIGALPQWCLGYLLDCAFRVEQLAAMRDFRREDMQPKLHMVDGDLTPEGAANLLPAALRFVRPGWSAFREYRDEDLTRMLLTLHELDPTSMSFSDIMDMMGWTDERNARRKIAKIRRGRT